MKDLRPRLPRYRKHGLDILRLPGTRFEVDFIYREIFSSNNYLPGELELNDGDCVLDVGANIGLFSLYVMRRARNLHLVAVEPAPDTFRALRHNLARPHDSGHRVILINSAVSDSCGNEQLCYYPHNPANSTFHAVLKAREFSRWDDFLSFEHARSVGPLIGLLYVLSKPFLPLLKPLIKRRVAHLHASPEFIDCPTTTISQIISEHGLETVDLLKIDVEGHELAVLQGVDQKDWRRIGQLTLEISTLMDVDHLAAVVGYLERRGYAVSTKREADTMAMLYARRK